MGEPLRLAVGVMGNAASLMLFAAPILTFKRVIKKSSTEEFSCIPYTLALLNCLLYTWYGSPVVSIKWENFPVVTINGFGVLMEASFIIIYIWFASVQRKKQVYWTLSVVNVVFCVTALVSRFCLHDHHHRKLLVGCTALVASASMYASPLVAVRQVIRTRSVEFMPFYLSFFSFLASSLWMTYGLLSHDLLLASPNILGSPLSLLQIVLYCVYRKKKGVCEEPSNLDVEKSSLQLKPLPPVSNV